ncbi:MAG TPA: WHG domain-containing protein [Mycobacterium sp.]|nr:WHG domain-containing protein [Mycobacterium sp.]HPZ96188.1 WHG domain-containing protein [Mycobacterium sp.]HQE16304.1 WHG domain-containing protein [Mycobacterium sp.]
MSTRPRPPAKLSREVIVNAALTFLDREGWDALTINALAAQLGTKGPSLYNHVHSLDDLRHTVRMRVIDDILHMLSTVGAGRTRDDAVMAMASAYRSYAHHHPGRYSAFTRMPLGGDDPEFTAAAHAAAMPVISVLASYGLDGQDAFYAALEFWAALHGFVLLEMTGVMDPGVVAVGTGPDAAAGMGIDPDAVFTDMVLRLATGMAHRRHSVGG